MIFLNDERGSIELNSTTKQLLGKCMDNLLNTWIQIYHFITASQAFIALYQS